MEGWKDGRESIYLGYSPFHSARLLLLFVYDRWRALIHQEVLDESKLFLFFCPMDSKNLNLEIYLFQAKEVLNSNQAEYQTQKSQSKYSYFYCIFNK